MTKCTTCAKDRLITIRMRIAGRDVVFQRCSACETNTWQENAGAVPLARVLELARAR